MKSLYGVLVAVVLTPCAAWAQGPSPYGPSRGQMPNGADPRMFGPPAGVPQLVSYSGAEGQMDANFAAEQGMVLPPRGMSTSPLGQVAQIPPQAAPWPTISPFDTTYNQTYNDDGLWRQAISFEPNRKKYVIIEALVRRARIPNREPIGDRGTYDLLGGTGTFQLATLGVLDNEVIGGDETILPQAVGQQQDDFPAAPGAQVTMGHWNQDGSGLQMIAFWQLEQDNVFKRGLDAPGFDPQELANSARITEALPLLDDLGGVLVPYDQLFRVTHSTEFLGTEINLIKSKIWGDGAFTVKPIFGLRYMYLQERFMFEGRGSGLLITFNPDGTSDPSSVVPGGVAAYRAELTSSVTTQLAGPQAGLHYELGGNFLKLIGASKFGVLASHEKIGLRGFGIGDGFSTNSPFEQDRPFSQQETNLHVSPLFEQSLTIEANIIKHIPVIRRIRILEEARFRAGYSFTAIWQVSRPGDTINWRGQPTEPTIRTHRSRWYNRGWNFGFVWDY